MTKTTKVTVSNPTPYEIKLQGFTILPHTDNQVFESYQPELFVETLEIFHGDAITATSEKSPVVVSETDQELADLTAQLKTANAAKTAAINAKKTAETQVTSLTAQLKTANTAKTAAINAKKTAETQVTDLTAQLKTANAQITDLTAQLAAAKKKTTTE